MLAAAGAMVAGIGASLLVAPRIIARQAPAVSGDSAEAVGAEGEGKGEEADRRVFALENIIVNPAGSQGTRFLMVSIGIEAGSSEMERKLKDHELELRDLVISILESQTLAMLAAPGARDSLKRRIAESIAPVMGPKVKAKIYLPQFVIQ
jgi:flagellar FliL protein